MAGPHRGGPLPAPIRMRVRFDDPHGIAGQIRKMPRIIKNSMELALTKEATALVRAMRAGIRRQAPAGQAFKPLAASTIAMKGSSKALIDKGDLIASIATRNLALARRSIARFVGVHRTALGKDGRNLANIAEIHEFGTKPYTIPVTPKLRAWWAAMAAKGIFAGRLSKGRTAIHHPGVPARPFLRPPFEKWQEGFDDRLNARVLEELQKKIHRDMLRRRP